MKIIITGNPVDGMTFHGPYEEPPTDWNDGGGDWWVASQPPPETVGIVEVTFPVMMTVIVDLDNGYPIESIVQTPNVSTMSQARADCHWHERDSGLRFGRPATDDEIAGAVAALDKHNWPKPDLVS